MVSQGFSSVQKVPPEFFGSAETLDCNQGSVDFSQGSVQKVPQSSLEVFEGKLLTFWPALAFFYFTWAIVLNLKLLQRQTGPPPNC
eukprot:1102804-Amphidinium_carterae.1